MLRIVSLIILLLVGCNAAIAQTVPFKLHDGYLIVAQCSVANRPNLTAVIDTGVSETVIDVNLARTLGLKLRSDTAVFVNKEAAVWAVAIPQVQLGPIKVDSLAGIAADLSALKPRFGIRPDLLIGMDLLHRSSFTIDYKSRLLTFGTVQALTHQARVVEDPRFLTLDATVSGQALRLQLDTGINGILLYAGRSKITRKPELVGAHVMGISESSSVQAAESEVRIGSWRSRGDSVSLVDGDPASGYFDGLLGAKILTSRRIAIDFDKGLVYGD